MRTKARCVGRETHRAFQGTHWILFLLPLPACLVRPGTRALPILNPVSSSARWGSYIIHRTVFANLIIQGLAHSKCLIVEVIIILGPEFWFSQILVLDKDLS